MFAEIALPNAKPAVAALAIFSFQGSWNAFLEPLIYISRQEYFTLPLGLAYFRRTYYTDWPVVMALALITTLPLAVFFVIFQRWFVAGVTRSGITSQASSWCADLRDRQATARRRRAPRWDRPPWEEGCAAPGRP